MSMSRPERVFLGHAASDGVAIGTIALHRVGPAIAKAKGTPEEEQARLDRALVTAAEQLGQLIDKAGEAAAGIIEFQLALIEDNELIGPVRRLVDTGKSSLSAWRRILDAQTADYQAAEDEYFRARALDIADLRDRVADILADVGEPAVAAGDQAIFVGADLAPSRFLEIDWQRYRGAALIRGSSASHVAILARAQGVPLVVGLDASAASLVDGAGAILDAEAGRLIQDPAPETRALYVTRQAAEAAAAADQARYLMRPAQTARGEPVRVYINIDDPRRLASLDAASCDGVGLTRTEFLFHGPSGLPDEETQLATYQAILDWARDRPVTIRTLDAGGDKPIAGLTPEGESNPFLGLRGLRLSLARPDVFRVQLRALARAAVRGNLKVMLPMVTRPQEFEQARALFAEVVAELRGEGVAAAMPSLGMMVEVPAAALNIAAFAADFYSIGSNDLVQYVTATGRDCAAVQALHDPLDPAVLELIRRVVEQGARTGREVSLCGDMAADARYLPALLDTGLRVVSVAPARMARVKAAIATYGASYG
jgi:phosphotransferase system enzyme I (PtsI)